MASQKQIEFFQELVTRKQWPSGVNTDELKAKFAQLPQAEASRWVDRALELPNGEDSGTPVPF